VEDTISATREAVWYSSREWFLILIAIATLGPFLVWMLAWEYGTFEDDRERQEWFLAGMWGSLVLLLVLTLAIV
jgi:hypothetical protein